MKRIFLVAICLLPMVGVAQQQQTFTIKGKVGSLNTPAKAYLSYFIGQAYADSVELKNGNFEFKGTVNEPILARITVKRSPIVETSQRRAQRDVLELYLENAMISVQSADSIKYAKITGSKLNDDKARLNALLKSSNDRTQAWNQEYASYTAQQKKDAEFMKPMMAKHSENWQLQKLVMEKFINENSNSYVGLETFKTLWLLSEATFDPKVIEPQFLKFPAELRNTTMGKYIAEKIAGTKNTQIGMVTDFIQYDRDGKPVKLSDFKGKYVLVDFWASWCGPCRAENPNVLSAYNKYKDNNFTVLAVSLDANKDAWLKAVEQDKLPWTQVSDGKSFNSEVVKSYGFTGIPFNFLVDPTGKIVATDLRGEALQKQLPILLGVEGKTK